ncbi:MAG: pilus assembly protein N-terminal domain-containing protein [bacterium]
MKTAAMMLAAVFFGLVVRPAFAQEEKTISLTEGEMHVVAVPFVISSYRLADDTIAKVELFDNQNLRVIGQVAGSTDLQVKGSGNQFATFTVTVVENVKAILDAMRRDLDEVPEVDLNVSLGRIVIRGEVNNVGHWDLLQKVALLYGDRVANLATFRPAPEVLVGLKQDLEKAGYKVVDRSDPLANQPGYLTVEVSANNLFINGTVFSRNDLANIQNVISAQRWLAVTKAGEEPKEDKIHGIINVTAIPSLIELDVAFLNVTAVEEKQVGLNLVKNGLLLIDSTSAAFQGNLDEGSSGIGGTYTIASGLQGVLRMYGASGPGRRVTKGHMTFKNDAPDWQTYQSGGTLKVRVTSENAADLEDIEYGFIMKVKGGLVNSEIASLDLDLELSFPIPIGQDYDLKREHLFNTVNVPLNKTLVMGGINDLSEKASNEGVPFLRNVPMLSYLFSEKNQRIEDRKVLILISPSLTGVTLPGTKYSDSAGETIHQTEQPLKETEKENKQKDKETEGFKRFF